MSKKWKPNDRVKLTADGPVMIVLRQFTPFRRNEDTVHCQWFDEDHKLQRGYFPPDSLTEAEGG